jgi:uncharacterized protein YndB with AHSA1/START domain
MSDPPTELGPAAAGVTLVVRRTINAPAARLFDAWTEPAQLLAWWGPAGVECSAAEVDLRVGGLYRIANRFPDGTVLWISGEFERIERPHTLIYTWRIGAPTGPAERVTVRFEPQGTATEVLITHERIPDPALRERHAQGWNGCLDGLVDFLSARA